MQDTVAKCRSANLYEAEFAQLSKPVRLVIITKYLYSQRCTVNKSVAGLLYAVRKLPGQACT